jgi:hypothetical protein
MHGLPEEKEEGGDDSIHPKSRRCYKSERKENASRARILSLPRSRLLGHGEEKEQRDGILGKGGFTRSTGQRFLTRMKRFRIEEEGDDQE